MNNMSLVIFDVDGVLLDSLLPHLQICKDKSKEYGLNLRIPTVEEFRSMVRKGVKISPMEDFFKAVGFSGEYLDLAVKQYNETFMRDYVPKPFEQVPKMLEELVSSGLKLGIVTSNVRANVCEALGESMQLFCDECVFTKDNVAVNSKAEALILAAKNANVNIDEVIYVGDQLADWNAAKKAHTQFLGVTYGWGISTEDKDFPTVDKVIDIAKCVLAER